VERSMADKAILFGVNDYKSITGLPGCENDLKFAAFINQS
jgi:hypothetical protein